MVPDRKDFMPGSMLGTGISASEMASHIVTVANEVAEKRISEQQRNRHGYFAIKPGKVRIGILVITLLVLTFSTGKAQKPGLGIKSKEAIALNQKLAQGWSTWNVHSVLSHTFLPQCFAVNLQLQDSSTGEVLKEAFIGKREEIVTPGPHSWDGSYTELKVEWRGISVQVKTAASGKDLSVIVTPDKTRNHGKLIIKPDLLWGKAGKPRISGNTFYFDNETDENSATFQLFATGQAEWRNGEMICPLEGKIVLSTLEGKSAGEIEAFVDQAGKKFAESKKAYAPDTDLYDAMQTVLAWNVIYSPSRGDVISPVSRLWAVGWGGWVLFEWDTYFASFMYAFDNKELAYANVIAITKEITGNGFIPGFGSGVGKCNDRSQIPVGCYLIWKIYERYKEKWLLREVFDELVSWNRWWASNRTMDGYIVLGSDPYKGMDRKAASESGKKIGCILESLDNSPMYDEAPFDSVAHRLALADVGQISLYINECKSLSRMANELGEMKTKKELDQRTEKYSKKLQTLWDEKTGIYLNKNLVTGEFSHRLSPTLFYSLLSGVPTQQQAERMIKEHFYNPREFWGDWILPSISRNDKDFDNDYWRGKVWGPMNFLVYCGLKNYDLPEATKDLVEKSKALFLKNWVKTRHVCENYHSVTGDESDDRFYHWGALLGLMTLLENEKTNR